MTLVFNAKSHSSLNHPLMFDTFMTIPGSYHLPKSNPSSASRFPADFTVTTPPPLRKDRQILN